MKIELDTERELEEIYREMASWPKANEKLTYAIPSHEVSRRESILILQQMLYKIEDAIETGDKDKEHFNLALYYLTQMATQNTS